MKVIQLDVNNVEFVPIDPEMTVHEPAKREKVSVNNALVLLTSIETDDTEAYASQAVKDAVEFAAKNKLNFIVMYPFVHITDDPEEPQRAMNLFQYMVKEAQKSKLNVVSAPFGWNKRLSLDIKGHPLAEASRSYGKDVKKSEKKAKRIDTSIVKKSDFSGLPETDHRIIGERLNLFSFQEVSPGMVYWHHNGNIVFKELMKFIREKLDEYNYEEIATPILANTALWHVSGHYDHYRENMFIIHNEGEDLGLKPMNCPSTMLVYKSRKWSYRDLPLRFADFDKLYRNEISGSLTGLFRVREMTQDDAHIFCTEEQIEEELTSVMKFVKEMYERFNLEYKPYLATMPDSHLGTEELWKKAEGKLAAALKANKIKYEMHEKDGAFYGPKIDIYIKDSMNREWQCATIQLDYQLPQRFDLQYTGEDGKEHAPVVIHRVIYGSLERFIGIITEHYQGKFPLWMSPVQVRVISISEQSNKYAEQVYKQLKHHQIRAELDISDKTLDYKIRDGQTQKIPYMLILGKKEMEANKVSVRSRSGKQKMGLALDEFISSVFLEIKERKNELML